MKNNDMKRKSIIFDMGGVLVDLDLKACREAFIRKVSWGNLRQVG